jgi:hypothetical protein
VNKKKCPKCGEENPAEAVMCWACYTPLAGSPAGAGAAPAGAAPGVAPAATGEKEKTKIPPWQMGVLGVGLLAALFVGARTLMPASSSDDDGGDTETTSDSGDTKPPEDGASTPDTPAPTAVNPVVISSNGTASVMPDKAPFSIVVPPNPRLSVGTMAILPTEANTSGPQAAALAAYTRRQYSSRVKSWDTLYIYVFSDAKSASYFADYQKRRKGAALNTSDYSFLANLWSSCLARYEYSASSGGKRVERVLYPSKNPSGWWYSSRGNS